MSLMSRTVKQEPPQVQSLTRGLELFKAILNSGGSQSLTALSQQAGLHKATASRLLRTLVNVGFVELDQQGHYRVHPGLTANLGLMPFRAELQLQISAAMVELRDACGETAALYVAVWPDRILVAQEESRLGLRRVHTVGERWPLTVGANGRAYLAFATDEQVDRALEERPLSAALTDRQPPTEAEFRAQLAEAREKGYAIAQEDVMSGMSGVAAPILDGLGRPIATLGLSGPVSRWNTGTIGDHVPLLLRCAARLSAVASGGATAKKSRAVPRQSVELLRAMTTARMPRQKQDWSRHTNAQSITERPTLLYFRRTSSGRSR